MARKARSLETWAASESESVKAPKPRKAIPHEFVLEAIASQLPWTRPMFGCLAVYVGEKIVLILRDKRDGLPDDGIWIATAIEHHASLRPEFPNMRSVHVFGREVTDWQVLPTDSLDFEEAALRACELILQEDPRIGRVPKPRRRSPATKEQPSGAR